MAAPRDPDAIRRVTEERHRLERLLGTRPAPSPPAAWETARDEQLEEARRAAARRARREAEDETNWSDDERYVDACFRAIDQRLQAKEDPRAAIQAQYQERCNFAARLSAVDDRKLARRLRWASDADTLPLLREAARKRAQTLAEVLDGTHKALPEGAHALRIVPKLGCGTIGARFTDKMRESAAWRYQVDWRRVKALETQCCVSYPRALQSVLLARADPGDGTVNRALKLCMTANAYADPVFDWNAHVRAGPSGRATPPVGVPPPLPPVPKFSAAPPEPKAPAPKALEPKAPQALEAKAPATAGSSSKPPVQLELSPEILYTLLKLPPSTTRDEASRALCEASVSLVVNGTSYDLAKPVL